MKDHIFGEMAHLQERFTRYREDLRGVKHSRRIVPINPVPGCPIGLELTTSGPHPYDAAFCFFTTDGTEPSGESSSTLELSLSKVEWITIEWGYIQDWIGELPPQPAGTIVRYRIAARIAGSNELIFADNQARIIENATDFVAWVNDNPEPPTWSREAIIYHIFLDRFYPGDGKDWLKPKDLSGFFGGTLRGIIHKLDYIQSLGFNVIWLSPIFPSMSHHGYNATDYFTIEPRLGSNDDMKELIEGAHVRGIRIILDFVANHWSKSHPTFKEAQQDSESPYVDWYIWKRWPDDYETYFDVKELPRLNLAHGPVRDYLLKSAQHWLNEGVDGYRLDHALGPRHDFWVDFLRACRSVNSECWLFGEVVDSAPVQLTYAMCMDGTLDFLFSRALRRTFVLDAWSLDDFESFLAMHEIYFPASFSRPAFLDNHDTDRALFIAGEDKNKVKLAALVLFTLSNPPIVYYGTEAGMTQERAIHQGEGYDIFEEARLPMKWGMDQDADLLAYFRKLTWLRRHHPVLQRGTRRLVHLNADSGTYAYLRGSGSDQALVVINLGETSASIPIVIPGFIPGAEDHLGVAKVNVDRDQVNVQLPAKCGAFISKA